jgi:hypothetical protein
VRWAAVHVGQRGAQPLPRRIVRPALSQCSSSTSARALLVARFDSGTLPATAGTAAAEETRVKRVKPVERVPNPEAAVLPFAGIEQAASDLPPVLGLALLAVLAASLVALGLFVVRFIRSSSA